MKIKNLHLYPKTVEERDRLVEEYRMIGFTVTTEDNKITVFSLPPKKKEKKEDQKRPRNDDRPRIKRG